MKANQDTYTVRVMSRPPGRLRQRILCVGEAATVGPGREGHRAHRGGPRNSDSLRRWDPDPGEGVWHATEETELSC